LNRELQEQDNIQRGHTSLSLAELNPSFSALYSSRMSDGDGGDNEQI